MDGEFTKGTSRADILTAAVTYLEGLTDTTSAFYAAAAAYRTTVADAVTWSEGAGATVLGVAALRSQQGHTEEVVGQSFTLTTAADTVFGTAGDDTVTATDTTYTATDMIADSTATDNDTLTVTAATDVSATPTVLGIENVNFIASGMLAGGDTTFTVDVANVKGGANIDVSASNAETLIAAATVNNIATGSTVTTDSKMATLTAAIATDANVTINSEAAAVSLSTTGASKNLTVVGAGDVTITASAAKGDVTVTGAAVDVTAGSTLTNVVVTASDTAVVTADAALGNVTVNATGDVTVSAAAAKGAIVVTSGEDIVDVDGAGAATSATLTAVGAIAATGDHAILSAAKALTASAGKASFIDADAAKSVTLTSTGTAEVVFTLAAAAVDTLALAGDSAINVVIETQDLDTETVTSTNTAGAVLTLKETVDLSAAADLSNVASNVSIRLGADFDGETLTLANEGAVVQLDAEVAQAAGSAKPVLAAKTSTSAATNSLTIQAADSVTTDAVDDTANLAGLTVTSYGTVNLVAGTDAITSTGNIVGDELTRLVVTGTKAVSLAEVVGSATTAATVDASGLAANFALTLNSTANGAEKVIGGSKVDTITISAAAASGNTFDISTGAGNDVFNVDAVVNLKIDGGAGTDTIVTAGDFSAKTLNLTSVESIKLTADTTLKGSYLLDKTFLIETDAGASGDDLIVSVDAATTNVSTLAFASSMASDDLVKIDGSVLGALAQTITGSSHNDVITGGSGADTITGGAGADTIKGGAGNDTLTGGTGADKFQFSAITVADNGKDTVTDFVIGADGDVIDFSQVGFALALANANVGGVVTVATTTALATEGTSIAVADNKAYYAEVADITTVDTVAELVTALANGGVLDAVDITAGASNVAALVLKQTDGTGIYVYGYTDDANAAGVEAAELALIGVFTATADGSMNTANFASA
jgi:Ca2+-binding RTX toxin-like protein